MSKKYRYRHNHKHTTFELDQIARELIDKLNDKGFVIHRYDTCTSNSIYLRLDYCVCQDVRISDHPSGKKCKIRYNVVTDEPTGCRLDESVPRYYFDATQLDELVELIMQDKLELIETWGTLKYQKYMYFEKVIRYGDEVESRHLGKRVGSKVDQLVSDPDILSMHQGVDTVFGITR